MPRVLAQPGHVVPVRKVLTPRLDLHYVIPIMISAGWAAAELGDDSTCQERSSISSSPRPDSGRGAMETVESAPPDQNTPLAPSPASQVTFTV
jgi:hypothetical protein